MPPTFRFVRLQDSFGSEDFSSAAEACTWRRQDPCSSQCTKAEFRAAGVPLPAQGQAHFTSLVKFHRSYPALECDRTGRAPLPLRALCPLACQGGGLPCQHGSSFGSLTVLAFSCWTMTTPMTAQVFLRAAWATFVRWHALPAHEPWLCSRPLPLELPPTSSSLASFGLSFAIHLLPSWIRWAWPRVWDGEGEAGTSGWDRIDWIRTRLAPSAACKIHPTRHRQQEGEDARTGRGRGAMHHAMATVCRQTAETRIEPHWSVAGRGHHPGTRARWTQTNCWREPSRKRRLERVRIGLPSSKGTCERCTSRTRMVLNARKPSQPSST